MKSQSKLWKLIPPPRCDSCQPCLSAGRLGSTYKFQCTAFLKLESHEQNGIDSDNEIYNKYNNISTKKIRVLKP